jgi:hypothetical protein
VNTSYIATSVALLAILATSLYLLFYLLFRRAITSLFDPLNYWALLVALYLAGASILPLFYPVNRSYYYVIGLIFLYILSAAIASRTRATIGKLRLQVGGQHQMMFAAALDGLLAINLVANQFFGVMPLLQGTEARAGYGAVALPTLQVLAPDMGLVILLLFLMTNIRAVRVITGIGVLISIVSTIVGGSKSAIFDLLFIVVVGLYVSQLKLRSCDSEYMRGRLVKRINRLKKVGWMAVIGVTAVAPAYLTLIGAASGGAAGALQTLVMRLFTGFDGLAILVVKDVDLTAPHPVSLSGFYLYPILGKFGATPDFQSAGVYIRYLLTGSYRAATSGLNPNSTFPIELLLASNSWMISAIVIICTSFLLFHLRSWLLSKSELRMLDLMLLSLVVFGPFSMLLDGSSFVIRSYELIGLYFGLTGVFHLIAWLGPGRKLFKLL